MDYVRLGRSGLRVSRIGLGTMNFGHHTDEAEAHAILDRAWECGIRLIDCADVYQDGRSEEIVGRWLAAHPERRDGLVLATKGWGTTGPGPNDRGSSAFHLRAAVNASLRRLQTDRIDLYQLHHHDPHTPFAETWEALQQRRLQGDLLYIGSSNFPGWALALAVQHSRRDGGLGLVSEQSLYGLNDRMTELEVLPACEALEIGLLAWGPLSGGRLAPVRPDQSVGRRAAPALQQEARDRAAEFRRWEALCAELGAPPASVAIAWVLAHPVVSSVLIGPRTVDQLHGCIHGAELRLEEQAWQQLDRLFPGPGPAPQAYAW